MNRDKKNHKFMKKKKISVVTLLIITVVFAVILYNVVSTKAYLTSERENFEIFYADEIEGRVMSVRSGSSGTTLILQDSTKYKFRVRSTINKGPRFSNTAKSGDKVKKQSSSDTLLLFQGNIVYRFIGFSD
jgi:regulatory protein YycI of two-component signal transduction system YycFG